MIDISAVTNIETIINNSLNLRELYIDLHLLKFIMHESGSATNVIKSSNIEYLYLDSNNCAIEYNYVKKYSY